MDSPQLPIAFLKRTLNLTILSGSDIAAGLVCQFVVLFYFGLSPQTDAHVASQTLPLLATSLIIGTLPQVLVPLFQEHGGGCAKTLLWIFAATFALITAGLFLATDAWVPVIFFALSAATLELAIELSKVQVWSIFFMGVMSVGIACLRAEERFVVGEVAQLIGTMVCLVLIVPVLNRWGMVGASVLLVARSGITMVLVAVPIVLGRAVALPARPMLQALWRPLRPLLLGAPIYKTAPVVDRIIAGMGAPGVLSIFMYSQSLWGLGLRLYDRTIATPFLSLASRANRSSTLNSLWRRYKRRLTSTFAVTGVVVAGFGAIGYPLLHLVGTWIPMGGHAASDFWLVAFVLGLTLVGGAAGQLSAAGMYGLGETRVITLASLASFAASTIVKLVAFLSWGIMGLVFGSILLQFMNHWILHRYLRRAVAT